MADRREMLEEALNQAAEGTLEAPEEKEILNEEQQEPVERDEKGRFVSKSEEEPVEAAAADENKEEVEPAINEVVQADEEPVQKPKFARPTTWKKEYLGILDKIESGEPLTDDEKQKHFEYFNQRESEYKKGVSVYKAEADNARELNEAIAPFRGELEQQGIKPGQWVSNLARAHVVLSKAPYEQRVQLFHRLAADYGIQLNQEGVAPAQQPAQDPYTQQLMQQLQVMNQEVSTIKSKYEQEEQTRLMSEIEKFKSSGQAPHFELVREEMAQLLERNLASDLKSAYDKAVRLKDEVWALEQEKLLKTATQQASKTQQVAKAKATAVSPRSVTPNGTMTAVEAKDRRSLIAKQLGEAMSDRV
jgi:hypothetical protein